MHVVSHFPVLSLQFALAVSTASLNLKAAVTTAGAALAACTGAAVPVGGATAQLDASAAAAATVANDENLQDVINKVRSVVK